jgi:ribose transport system substrate-binding protein
MRDSRMLLLGLLCALAIGCQSSVVVSDPDGSQSADSQANDADAADNDGDTAAVAASRPVFTILGTRTDGFDFGQAKALPEDTLTAHPGIDCMVGLFAYNPPYILQALKGVDKVGEVTLIGFDEADETLQAIQDGECHGTVVQDPYLYGYESVKLLASLARGEEGVIPEGGSMYIPARKITADNVDEFWDELKQRVADGQAAAANAVRKDDRPTIGFVTNGIASFWVIAEAGARKAGEDFDVNVEVRMPAADGAAANQKRMLESLVVAGVDGIAVSPINSENQNELLNQIGESTILITHDSDAPDSNRLAYIGMDNYDAGWMCGELIHEALPDGGSLMIFVGRLEQENARLRRQGLIDYLLGREADSSRYDEPGQELEGSPKAAE